MTPSRESWLLGIDIGTASTKAVLARPDGSVRATAQRHHVLSLPRPGWAEHDAESVWWDDIRSVCAELPVAEGRLEAICVSGIGPCLLPCDADHRPLRPAILYGIDTRASAEIEELNHRYGEATLMARGGSALSSQAVGPKLLWLQRHEPAVWAKARKFLMASSFAVARLTGEYVLDHHSASQCDPLYDLRAGDWARDLAEEIAPGLALPRLAWPGEVAGTVTAEGARASGLPPGIPVLTGTIDAWAEAFSAGVRSPGDLMLMYGSTMFLIRVLGEPTLHPKLWATVGVQPGTHCLAAGMATAGSVTAWLRKLTGRASFATLMAEAAAVPAGANGLLMLPHFAGERSPVFDPDARGTLAGLTLRHSRGDLMRATYEAIGYGVRHNLEAMMSVSGAPERVFAVGGGTTGRLWTQIVSDITGLAQRLPGEATGASYGDALLAAIAVGLADPDADWGGGGDRVSPNATNAERYDELYALYLRLYEATQGVSHRLAELQRASHGSPAL